jgi:hypothetical protein
MTTDVGVTYGGGAYKPWMRSYWLFNLDGSRERPAKKSMIMWYSKADTL